MAVTVHVTEPVALHAGPHETGKEGREHESGPEAHRLADLVGEVGTQHEHAGVGEVEHAHHAEDEGEPARQHEEEEAIDEAVEQSPDRGRDEPRPHPLDRFPPREPQDCALLGDGRLAILVQPEGCAGTTLAPSGQQGPLGGLPSVSLGLVLYPCDPPDFFFTPAVRARTMSPGCLVFSLERRLSCPAGLHGVAPWRWLSPSASPTART